MAASGKKGRIKKAEIDQLSAARREQWRAALELEMRYYYHSRMTNLIEEDHAAMMGYRTPAQAQADGTGRSAKPQDNMGQAVAYHASITSGRGTHPLLHTLRPEMVRHLGSAAELRHEAAFRQARLRMKDAQPHLSTVFELVCFEPPHPLPADVGRSGDMKSGDPTAYRVPRWSERDMAKAFHTPERPGWSDRSINRMRARACALVRAWTLQPVTTEAAHPTQEPPEPLHAVPA